MSARAVTRTLAALAASLFASTASAQTPVKLGVLADMSGIFSDIGGMGAAEATRMAADPGTDLRPAVLVAVAFAAFDTALMRWVEDGSATDLNALLSECFAAAFPG